MRIRQKLIIFYLNLQGKNIKFNKCKYISRQKKINYALWREMKTFMVNSKVIN